MVSWSNFVRRGADEEVLVDSRASASGGGLPTALWGDPLPPHSLENVGVAPLRVVSVELKAP